MGNLREGGGQVKILDKQMNPWPRRSSEAIALMTGKLQQPGPPGLTD